MKVTMNRGSMSGRNLRNASETYIFIKLIFIPPVRATDCGEKSMAKSRRLRVIFYEIINKRRCFYRRETEAPNCNNVIPENTHLPR